MTAVFTIGEFARHGRVSVRMLRHYDAIGLLRPARVDPVTGHRAYEAGQLIWLNRIVALKDLGFTLEQIRAMSKEDVSVEHLRGMLTLRRAELESALAVSRGRLTQIEARLRTLETEGRSAPDVIVKRLPATRMVELTGVAASFHPEDMAPVVRPMCAELGRRLPGASAVVPTGRLTCFYEQGDEDTVVVHAALPAKVTGGDLNGLSVIDLPETEAATLVHRGAIEAVLPAWQALVHWVEATGRRSARSQRELYLDCPEDPDGWVTELQEPLSPVS